MKYYTVCKGPYRDTGLLFSDTAVDDVIMDDPALHAIFPDGFFAVPVSTNNPRYGGSYYSNRADKKPKHTLVCPNVFSPNLRTPYPDEAAADTGPVVFYRKGVKARVNLRQRYNQCLSLFKAVGCAECPDRGLPCISEGLGVGLENTKALSAGDAEELLAGLTKVKHKFGDYEFAPPGLTKRKDFSSTIRDWWEHDFTNIEGQKKSLSQRATAAATTRKFKREYCASCPIAKGCNKARYCRGPYPLEELVIRDSLESLNAAIARGSLKPWQIWELNRAAGNVSKHSRWQIILLGVRYNRTTQQFTPCVYRAKTRITEYRKLTTYEEIAEVFGLAKSEATAAAPPAADDKLKAIWWQSSQLHGYETRGWTPKRVIGVSLGANKVTVQWGKLRYITWETTLREFSDISSQISYGSLPDAKTIYVR